MRRPIDDPIQSLAGDEGLGLFGFAFWLLKALCVGFRFVGLKMELKWGVHGFHLQHHFAPNLGGVKRGNIGQLRAVAETLITL